MVLSLQVVTRLNEIYGLGLSDSFLCCRIVIKNSTDGLPGFLPPKRSDIVRATPKLDSKTGPIPISDKFIYTAEHNQSKESRMSYPLSIAIRFKDNLYHLFSINTVGSGTQTPQIDYGL